MLPFRGKLPQSAYLQVTFLAGPKHKSSDPSVVVGKTMLQNISGPRVPFTVQVPDGVDVDKLHTVSVLGRVDGIPARGGCSDFVVDRNVVKTVENPTQHVVIPLRARANKCNSQLMAKLVLDESTAS